MSSLPVAFDRPQPHASVETAFLVPEVVLFDARHGEVPHLNPSASAVWTLLDGESTSDDVAVELSEIFSLAFEQTRVEVRTAIDGFRRRGLLDSARPDRQHDAVSLGGGSSPFEQERFRTLGRPPDP